MTKTQARAYVRRCREGLREFEHALKSGDADALLDWANEVGGSSAALYQYVEELNEGIES